MGFPLTAKLQSRKGDYLHPLSQSETYHRPNDRMLLEIRTLGTVTARMPGTVC